MLSAQQLISIVFAGYENQFGATALVATAVLF